MAAGVVRMDEIEPPREQTETQRAKDIARQIGFRAAASSRGEPSAREQERFVTGLDEARDAGAAPAIVRRASRGRYRDAGSASRSSTFIALAYFRNV